MSKARAPQPGANRLAEIYQRFRQLIHEGAKFGIVGLIGIGVTNLVFIPLHVLLHLGPLTSVTIATCVATVVTFIGNRYWSFRDRAGGGTRREGVMFFILNGIGLLIQYAVLGFSSYVLDLTTKTESVIAVNLGIGIGTLFRFWSYRKWVWVPPEVNLARLRRGRHRQGRDLTTVPPPALTGPALTGPALTGPALAGSGAASAVVDQQAAHRHREGG